MGSKKSTTKTNQTQTQTPNVPDWLSDPYKVQAQQVSKLQGMDPTQFASTPSALQTQAFNSAGQLQTSAPINQATSQLSGINYTPQQVAGQSLLTGLDQYYNPYKDQVMNPVLADLDHSAGVTRAAQSAKEAATGAFRGSRAGIAEGETEGDLARARATTTGGLLNQMYDTATGLSSQDAARRQEAATANASNALTANSQRQTGAGLLANIGNQNLQTQATLGGTQQALADSQKQAPLNYATAMEQLLAGLNPALFTGQTGTLDGTSTTKTSGNLASVFGNLLTAAAGNAASAGKKMGAG